MSFLNKFLQSIFGRNKEETPASKPRSRPTPSPAVPTAQPAADTTNLSTLDFMSIPAASRRLLRILLRKSEISDADLRVLVAELPEDKRPTDSEYQEAIADLTGRTWIVEYEMDGKPYYRVNLGSKVGSDESRTKPADLGKDYDGPSMPELWDAVDTTSGTDYRKRHTNDD